MYSGYNFMQQPQFGQMLPFGQQPDQQPMLGQGFLQQPQQQQGHHGGGMSPLMALSPLLGMFMSGHPNMALGMISPALGISRGLGLFK